MKKVFIFIELFVFFAFANVAHAQKTYIDLSESDPNYVAIQYLSLDEVGVFEGYEDGTFGPEKEINRAELMKVLVESVYGTPDEDLYKNCYPDVEED
ncbi:MAG: S-layer homology domain-containing protein, partial [Candidatus Gracilibacteria bacterium]